MKDLEIDIGIIKYVIENSILGFDSIPYQYRTHEVKNAMASCQLLKGYIDECFENNTFISEEYENSKKTEIRTSSSTTYIHSNKSNYSNFNERLFSKASSTISMPNFLSQKNLISKGENDKKIRSSVEAVNVDTSLFKISSFFGGGSSSSSVNISSSSSVASSSSEEYSSSSNNEDEKVEVLELTAINKKPHTLELDQLPKEIISNILKFLPTESLYNTLFVNRYMYNCALPYLWKNLNFKNTLNCFKFCSNFENNPSFFNNLSLYTETFNICFPNQGMNLYKFLLNKIINNCKNIKNIKVNKSLYWYMDKTISLFTKNCKNLEKIGLNGQWYQPEQTILSISKRCPKINTLKLNHVQFTHDNIKSSFNNFCSIKHLDLSGVNITNEVLNLIIDNNYNHLISVKLSDCTRLTDESIKPLIEKCQKLQYINLKGCHVSSQTLLEIGNRCSKLRVLCLDGIVNVTPEVINSIAIGCPNLSTLSLEKCHQVTNESIINLFKSVQSNLKHLCLSGLSLLNDDALIGLSFYCCSNLEKLDIDSVSMSEFAINNIMNNCTKLKSLIVQRPNTYITCTLSKWMQNEIRNKYSTKVEDFDISFVW